MAYGKKIALEESIALTNRIVPDGAKIFFGVFDGRSFQQMTIEELLEKPYWIIDILPARVPQDSPGQYFAIEKYILDTRLTEIKRRHVNVILKLNCYLDIAFEGRRNPPPGEIEKTMNEKYVYLMTGDAMILSEPDDTHMTVFNADQALLNLLKDIASSEGLFVWQPPQEGENK